MADAKHRTSEQEQSTGHNVQASYSSMKNNVLILADPARVSEDKTDWSKIGRVVTEISHLYQIVKESHIDLILVDDSHTDLRKAVATRIRRYNGLTEIWQLTDDGTSEDLDQEFLDGVIPRDLSDKVLAEKVARILHAKELLRHFGIVTRSPRMKVVAESIERLAPSDVAVLIVGPSGSGKELVAHAIHGNSNRSQAPFVTVNCGAIAEGILESELFGHEKGAFTGSISKREGLFHKADGGTMFLDEIGETKPAMQVKLLRVLEDGSYHSVGSSQTQRVDVRIVSATNRDLSEAIAERRFREDLYFRIGVVTIKLPPLMDRKCDIQPLLRHFWSEWPKIDYNDSALEMLLRYDWPGNIRQLRNFCQRMAALKPSGLVDVDDVQRFYEEQHLTATHLPVATGKTVQETGQELIYHAILSLGSEIKLLRDLITSHLPVDPVADDYASDDSDPTHTSTVEEMERKLIDRILQETDGNRKEAAERLGIGERTLYRKINKYKLRKY